MTTFLNLNWDEEPAWDGELEPLGQVMRGGQSPRISIGRPAVWDAAAAVKNRVGQEWTPPQDGLVYTGVGLFCTLHPLNSGRQEFTEVRFEAYLRHRQGNNPAVAHDLFPLQQLVQDKGKKSLGLTPEIKFVEAINLKIIEIGVEKEYISAFPVIQAYGLGESSPYWLIQKHSQFPLQGSQKLFMVAACPQDVPISLQLNLIVTVNQRGGLKLFRQPQFAYNRLNFDLTPNL